MLAGGIAAACNEIGSRQRERLGSVGYGALPEHAGELARLPRPALRNPRCCHGAGRAIAAPAGEALKQVLAAPAQPALLQQHHQPRRILPYPCGCTMEHGGSLIGSHRQSGNRLAQRRDPASRIERTQRRAQLDDLAKLNHQRADELGDPETLARIDAYEMAFRMQTSVPELTDISKESPATLDAYGPEVRKPGTYAANCLLARRLLERDVRFVQLFHRGWDQHIAIARQLPNQCHDIDQPTAALIKDLKVRGLLEDTLVVFATEFGRTVFSQGKLGDPAMGRDHHGRAFTVWLAGGGIKGGIEYGATDDFCYTSRRIRCTFATSTRRFCTASASTTRSSRTNSAASTPASPGSRKRTS